MAALSRGLLKELALEKRRDAELLYENKRYSNAYYLYGYAVELALKARVARIFVAESIPDKNFVNKIYDGHKLNSLINLAGLRVILDNEKKQRPIFDVYWAIVAEWQVEARYEMIDAVTASAMHNAINDEQNGVLAWLQKHW